MNKSIRNLKFASLMLFSIGFGSLAAQAAQFPSCAPPSFMCMWGSSLTCCVWVDCKTANSTPPSSFTANKVTNAIPTFDGKGQYISGTNTNVCPKH